MEIPVYTFTKTGNELLNIIQKTTDFHYFKDLAIFIKRNVGVVKYQDINREKERATGKPSPYLEFEWPSDVD